MKSDEKASLAPRTAGERAPFRPREIGKAGTPSSYPKPARSKRQVSPEAAKTSAKCGRRSVGGSSTRPDEKATVFGSIRPRNSHYSDWVSNTEEGLRKAPVAGKTVLRRRSFAVKYEPAFALDPSHGSITGSRTALRPGSLRGSAEGCRVETLKRLLRHG